LEFIEKHSSVRGKAVITVVCGKYKKEFQVTVWEKFLPDWVAGDHSGVDIEPLRELKIPASGLVTDSQRYFDIHHTPEDTFEKVNRRELLLGAVVMTQLIYMVDKNW
jgi:hypothetical protein